MRRVYADHAATTRPADEVVEAMRPHLGDGFGNPSSVHTHGEAARAALDLARARVAALLGATPEEIVFTASGSEGNNLALRGLIALAPATRRRLVVSAVEHNSVLACARALEAEGVPLTVLPVDAAGVVEPAALEAALGDDVALVSVMAVNNETGALQPVADLAARARAAGARFHCDAVQAAGKLAIDVDALGADLLTIAGHKLGGPPGAAALYVRRRVRLRPLVHGGHQERGRRAGTENLAGAVGLGVAAERAHRAVAETRAGAAAALGATLRERLLAAVPGARLNGDPARALASIVNVRFPGADGEALLHALDRMGIVVSTGSACSAADAGPSHVLTAMGLDPEQAHASVRFSLGEGNDAADVDRIVAAVPAALAELRSLAGGLAREGA